MSGYANSGLSREDYEARERLFEAARWIGQRWPVEYSELCRDLWNVGDRISEESTPHPVSEHCRPGRCLALACCSYECSQGRCPSLPAEHRKPNP